MLLLDQILNGTVPVTEIPKEPTDPKERRAIAETLLGLKIDDAGNVLDSNSGEVIGELNMQLDENKLADETAGETIQRTEVDGQSIRADLAKNRYVEENKIDVEDEKTTQNQTTYQEIKIEDIKQPEKPTKQAVPAIPTLKLNQATKQIVNQFEVTDRATVSQSATEEPTDEFGLRRYYGSVTTGTSTKMAPELLVSLCEEVMRKLKIKFDTERVGLYRCQRLNVVMTVELCRVATSAYCCIVFRRVSGDAWVYKELC